MPNFLYEYLWFLGSAGVVIGMTSLYAGLRSGNRRVQLGAILCLPIAAALFGIDYWLESPTEQVRAVLAKIVHSADRQDVSSLSDAVSSQYSDGTRNHDTLVSLIHSRMGDANIERISLAGLEFTHQNGDIQASFVGTFPVVIKEWTPGKLTRFGSRFFSS